MKFTGKILSLVGMLTLLPGGVAAMTLELGRGHFVVQVDETVATFDIVAVEVPGRCKPTLSAVQTGPSSIKVSSTDAGCQADPYAIVRLNPTWNAALTLRVAAGQMDFSSSAMQHIASMQATVKTGDIVGMEGVRRRWLVGAQLDFDHQRKGLAVRADLGAGQISLDPAAAK